MFNLPFLCFSLMHVPLLGDEGGDGGGGGSGAEGRDGGPLGGWECPDGRGWWVSVGVTVARLLSGEECVEMGGGKERWRRCWIQRGRGGGRKLQGVRFIPASSGTTGGGRGAVERGNYISFETVDRENTD